MSIAPFSKHSRCLVRCLRSWMSSLPSYRSCFWAEISVSTARGTVSIDLAVVRLFWRKVLRFIGFNKISHENISGKRAASGGAGLNVSVPAIISMRWSRDGIRKPFSKPRNYLDSSRCYDVICIPSTHTPSRTLTHAHDQKMGGKHREPPFIWGIN